MRVKTIKTIGKPSTSWYDLLMRNNSGNKILKEKNPAAVALGRLGGLKGGKARAAKLSAKRRSEIARKAVRVREQKRINILSETA